MSLANQVAPAPMGVLPTASAAYVGEGFFSKQSCHVLFFHLSFLAEPNESLSCWLSSACHPFDVSATAQNHCLPMDKNLFECFGTEVSWEVFV